jgi:hypothetical protein
LRRSSSGRKKVPATHPILRATCEPRRPPVRDRVSP